MMIIVTTVLPKFCRESELCQTVSRLLETRTMGELQYLDDIDTAGLSDEPSPGPQAIDSTVIHI